jgi:hypothetical protein
MARILGSPNANVPIQRSRLPVWAFGLTAALIVILFLPLTFSMVRYGNDYPGHIASAIAFETNGQFDRPRPQFLYHFSLIGIGHLLPISDTTQRLSMAAVLLGVITYLVTGVLLLIPAVSWLQTTRPPRRSILGIAVALALMFIGPINLLTWGTPNLLYGYLTGNTFHNPTVLLSKPFALIVFWYGAQAFSGRQRHFRQYLICAVIAFFGTLAKPSYSIAFIPALALAVFYCLVRHRPLDWGLLATIAIPILGVLGWQYFYHSDSMGGFEFAPLKVAELFPGSLGPWLSIALSLLFPVTLYILNWQKAHQDCLLNLAWLSFLIALAYYLLLAERADWQDGNFYWGVEVALWLLMIMSLRSLILRLLASTAQRTWLFAWLPIGLFTLHVIGGVALYVTHLMANWRNWL